MEREQSQIYSTVEGPQAQLEHQYWGTGENAGLTGGLMYNFCRMKGSRFKGCCDQANARHAKPETPCLWIGKRASALAGECNAGKTWNRVLACFISIFSLGSV